MSTQAGDNGWQDQGSDEASYTSYVIEDLTRTGNSPTISISRNPKDADCTDKHEVLSYIKILENQEDISYIKEIINSSHIGIALYKYIPEQDIFKFEIWSKGLADIAGFSFDEVNSERLNAERERISKHSQAFKDLMKELQQDPGNIIYQEKSFFNARGIKKTVSMTSTGVNRRDGFYILSLLKDITHEKEIESKIKESERQFKDFFELSPEASLIYTKDKILLVNNAAVKLFGFNSKDELTKLNILDMVHDDYKEMAELWLQQKEFTVGEVYSTRLVTHQGRIIDADVSFVILDYEGQKVIRTCIRDVTKRKEFERKLRESEEGYRRLINLLPYPVYVYDGKKVIYVNESVIRLMKAKDASELIGRRHRDLINMDESMICCFERILNEIISTDNTVTWEGTLQRKKDGGYIYVSVSVIKIPNGSSREFMIIVKDLEEIRKNEELKCRYDENRRQLEEALEYDKQRTEFFCNMSHELRTPINVILGAAQISSITMNGYKQLMEDEKLNRYMDIIKQNCMRLIRMTNNLIDITKIDFGYYNMKYTKGDIVNAVEEITLSVSEYVHNKGIQLIFDTDIEDRVIAFDYEKLERILLNLLSNAVKFTESGGNICVNVRNSEEYIYISVKDTGIGIPENMQEKIFERFIQVDMSLSRNAEGSGIGLALVKYLVEMHEGGISLKSTPGEGSEFTVKIPCYLKENTMAATIANGKNPVCLEKAKVEFSDIYFKS
jgi:PAS domain S-box-containing protein